MEWNIFPPTIQSMITAVIRATFPVCSGDNTEEGKIEQSIRPVTLHYEDGTTETAEISVPEENFLALVGNVQGKRKKGGGA